MTVLFVSSLPVKTPVSHPPHHAIHPNTIKSPSVITLGSDAYTSSVLPPHTRHRSPAWTACISVAVPRRKPLSPLLAQRRRSNSTASASASQTSSQSSQLDAALAGAIDQIDLESIQSHVCSSSSAAVTSSSSSSPSGTTITRRRHRAPVTSYTTHPSNPASTTSTARRDTLLRRDNSQRRSISHFHETSDASDARDSNVAAHESSFDASARRRKPHGYWNQLENIERELLLVNAQMGFAGRRMVPRIADMQLLGRGDLIAALMKHGGVREVAEALRWGRAPRCLTAVLPSQSSTSSSTSSMSSLGSRSLSSSSIVTDNINIISETPASSSPALQSTTTTTATTLITSATANTFTSLPRTTELQLRRTAAAKTPSPTRVREKIHRRPVAYWQNVERVHCEMSAFIDEFGTRGVMPTRKQLYAFGRADLANAAMRHGGLRIIAKQMGLRGRKDVKPRGFWTDFNAVRDALIDFSKASKSPGHMPTADELYSGGMSCLVNVVAAHGGFPSVAKKCGLLARNSKKQGAPLLWDDIRLKREYLSFLMTFYPDAAKQRILVGERQLRKHGRNDLSYAIQKMGGFAVLAQKLGLKKKCFSRKPKLESQDRC